MSALCPQSQALAQEIIESYYVFTDTLVSNSYDFPLSPTKYIPFYGGAEYHDYHHYVGGQSQSNFASVFTYCDYIYGTDKGYRYRKAHLAKIGEQRGAGGENGEPNGWNYNEKFE